MLSCTVPGHDYPPQNNRNFRVPLPPTLWTLQQLETANTNTNRYFSPVRQNRNRVQIPHQRFQPAHYRIPTRFLSLLPPRRCTHNLSCQATTSEAFHLVSSELQCIVLLHQTTTILYPLLETLSNHNLTLYTFFAVQLYCIPPLIKPQPSSSGRAARSVLHQTTTTRRGVRTYRVVLHPLSTSNHNRTLHRSYR